MSTSSVHKESTPSGIRLHLSRVKSFKDKLKGYGSNPFGEGPARNITTGKEVALEIIAGLLNAPKLGDDKYKSFVSERLVTGKVDYFSPIKKVGLNTGLKKTKRKGKVMSIIQEDRQGFGLLLSKNVNLEVALKYPITSVPLSLANPDGTLREAPKYLFRNDLIANAKALENVPPINARWIVDNMAAIRCVKPKDTYRT